MLFHFPFSRLQIREKQKSSQVVREHRDPQIEKKISEMKRLPELIRTIQSLFSAEKKKSISLTDLIERCCENMNCYSSDRCADLIRLTNELLPDWLLILKTMRGTFIKIDTGTVLKSLYDRLDRSMAKLENQR